jgi:hypothetical protein
LPVSIQQLLGSAAIRLYSEAEKNSINIPLFFRRQLERSYLNYIAIAFLLKRFILLHGRKFVDFRHPDPHR